MARTITWRGSSPHRLPSYEALTEAFLADPGFGIGRIHTTFVLKTLKSFDCYPVGDSRD